MKLKRDTNFKLGKKSFVNDFGARSIYLMKNSIHLCLIAFLLTFVFNPSSLCLKTGKVKLLVIQLENESCCSKQQSKICCNKKESSCHLSLFSNSLELTLYEKIELPEFSSTIKEAHTFDKVLEDSVITTYNQGFSSKLMPPNATERRAVLCVRHC